MRERPCETRIISWIMRSSATIQGTAFICAMLFGVAACGANPALVKVPPDAYSIGAVDEPENMRFRVTLESRYGDPFCIEAEAWPSATGRIGFGGHRALLVWRDGQVPAREGMQDFCPGGCQIVVPAKGILESTIGYEEFGEPSVISALPDKQLVLNIQPFRCIKASR